MILSDQDIEYALEQGDLTIEPAPARIEPASVDLHVSLEGGALRLVPGAEVVIGDGRADAQYSQDPCDGGALVLRPGDFALVSTRERVALADTVSAQVNGRSSVARLGLAVHVTAGWVDPGFDGTITLELVNMGSQTIVLKHGARIAQLIVFANLSPARLPYGAERGSHYQDQRGATGSRFGESVEGI